MRPISNSYLYIVLKCVTHITNSDANWFLLQCVQRVTNTNLPNSSGSMYSTAWMPVRYWIRPWMRVLFSPFSLSTRSIICCCLSIQYRWSPKTVRPTGCRMLESWRTIRLAPVKQMGKQALKMHHLARIFSYLIYYVVGHLAEEVVLLRKKISRSLRCSDLSHANIRA